MNLPCAVEHDLKIYMAQQDRAAEFDALFDSFFDLALDEIEDGDHDKKLLEELIESEGKDTKNQIIERVAKRIAQEKMENRHD